MVIDASHRSSLSRVMGAFDKIDKNTGWAFSYRVSHIGLIALSCFVVVSGFAAPNNKDLSALTALNQAKAVSTTMMNGDWRSRSKRPAPAVLLLVLPLWKPNERKEGRKQQQQQQRRLLPSCETAAYCHGNVHRDHHHLLLLYPSKHHHL